MADQAVLTGEAPARAVRPGGWPLGLLRVTATLYALATVAQPFLAGMFLSGSFTALQAHEATGQGVGGLGGLTLLCAILAWRLRGVSTVVVRMCAGLLAADVVEMLFGYNRTLVLHVPLGVGLVLGTARLALYAWREAGR